MELKDKLINAAYELFAEKGYDKTTVSDIIEMAGSSKGGFYHHFKSKDEILEAVTMNFMKDLIKYYDEILKESEHSVMDALNSVVNKINQYKSEQIKNWPQLRKIYTFSGNHIIIKKIADDFEKVTTEVYTKLIAKGLEKELFDVKYPELLAGLWTREVLRILSKATETIYSKDADAIKDFENLLDFSENMMNNALGVDNGGIEIKESAVKYVLAGRKAMGK